MTMIVAVFLVDVEFSRFRTFANEFPLSVHLGVSSRTLMKILRAGRGKCGLSDSKNNTRSAALDLHVNFQCKLELKSFRMSILVRTKQKRRTFHYAYI